MVAQATIFCCIHRSFSSLLAHTLLHALGIAFLPGTSIRQNHPQYKIEKDRTADTEQSQQQPHKTHLTHVPVKELGYTGAHATDFLIV